MLLAKTLALVLALAAVAGTTKLDPTGTRDHPATSAEQSTTRIGRRARTRADSDTYPQTDAATSLVSDLKHRLSLLDRRREPLLAKLAVLYNFPVTRDGNNGTAGTTGAGSPSSGPSRPGTGAGRGWSRKHHNGMTGPGTGPASLPAAPPVSSFLDTAPGNTTVQGIPFQPMNLSENKGAGKSKTKGDRVDGVKKGRRDKKKRKHEKRSEKSERKEKRNQMSR